jgi:uncharacterized membrane protein (DUF2068 family)
MFQAAVQNNINLALPKQNKKRQNDTNIWLYICMYHYTHCRSNEQRTYFTRRKYHLSTEIKIKLLRSSFIFFIQTKLNCTTTYQLSSFVWTVFPSGLLLLLMSVFLTKLQQFQLSNGYSGWNTKLDSQFNCMEKLKNSNFLNQMVRSCFFRTKLELGIMHELHAWMWEIERVQRWMSVYVCFYLPVHLYQTWQFMYQSRLICLMFNLVVHSFLSRSYKRQNVPKNWNIFYRKFASCYYIKWF